MGRAELQRWAAGQEYRSILSGDYPRRSEDKDAPMSDDVRAAANSYKESFQTSADPLFKVVGKLGSVAGGVGGTEVCGKRRIVSLIGAMRRTGHSSGAVDGSSTLAAIGSSTGAGGAASSAATGSASTSGSASAATGSG